MCSRLTHFLTQGTQQDASPILPAKPVCSWEAAPNAFDIMTIANFPGDNGRDASSIIAFLNSFLSDLGQMGENRHLRHKGPALVGPIRHTRVRANHNAYHHSRSCFRPSLPALISSWRQSRHSNARVQIWTMDWQLKFAAARFRLWAKTVSWETTWLDIKFMVSSNRPFPALFQVRSPQRQKAIERVCAKVKKDADQILEDIRATRVQWKYFTCRRIFSDFRGWQWHQR